MAGSTRPHTPDSLEADGVELDTLRRSFPGIRSEPT
jgi:hypothetical protein